MIKVGIVGGTGYTGIELLRILSQHPEASLKTITSRKEAGMAVTALFTSLRGRVSIQFSDPADAELGRCDIVFFATPNGIAMQQIRPLLEQGVRIIDLAAAILQHGLDCCCAPHFCVLIKRQLRLSAHMLNRKRGKRSGGRTYGRLAAR